MIYTSSFFGLWCHNPMLVIVVDALSLLFLLSMPIIVKKIFRYHPHLRTFISESLLEIKY